jgi:hypothetical protein
MQAYKAAAGQERVETCVWPLDLVLVGDEEPMMQGDWQHDSKRLKTGIGDMVSASPFPSRPGVAVCSFFLKTGGCSALLLTMVCPFADNVRRQEIASMARTASGTTLRAE